MARLVEGVNDLATLRPDILPYWDFEKNNKIRVYPNRITIGSGKRVNFKCKGCGGSYKQEIYRRLERNGLCNVCLGKECKEGVNDLATLRPDILPYWDYAENDKIGMYPNQVSCGSEKSAYFICKECGNSYVWKIKDRTKNKGICSFCDGRKVIEGVNDLATLRPDILPFWDYKENEKQGLYPNRITLGSNKSANFICEECGRSFDRSIRLRLNGQSICGVCSSKEVISGINDLATTHPHLLKFWNYEENAKRGLDPTKLVIGSSKEAYWICEKCGETYKQRISKLKKRHSFCSACAGHKVVVGKNDIATTCPELLKSWDYNRNNSLGLYPTGFIAGSHKEVYWICEKCGKSYPQEICSKSRTQNLCSVCTGRDVVEGINDIATTHPYILKYWDYKKNDEKGIYPTKISYGSDTKAYWICEQGHSTYTEVDRKIGANIRCPLCNVAKGTSYPEQYLFYYFSKIFTHVYNRYTLHGKEADIYIKDINLAIEYNGYKYHTKDDVISRDKKKKKLWKDKGVFYIRISEVRENKDEKNRIKRTDDGFIYIPFSNCKSNCEQLNRIILIIVQDINRYFGKNYKFVPEEYEKVNIKILEQLKKYDYEKSLAYKRPDLIKFWDYEMNGSLKPEHIYVSSKKEVYWKCSYGENHSYPMSLNVRTRRGINVKCCPYCSHQKLLVGFNDLATLCPEVLDIWDYDKNDVKPSEIVGFGGANSIHWICKKGHSWESRVADLNKNDLSKSCPYCSGSRFLKGFNDIETMYPYVVSDWDYKANEKLPSETQALLYKSKPHWKCHICGKEWSSELKSVLDRISNKGCACPDCAKKRNKQILSS